MIGSETFIMVAFKWRETICPSALALVNSLSKKDLIAAQDMTELSTTSPAYNERPDFKVVVYPLAPVKFILTVVGAVQVCDYSEEK